MRIISDLQAPNEWAESHMNITRRLPIEPRRERGEFAAQ
jgi:hypothetical protein